MTGSPERCQALQLWRRGLVLAAKKFHPLPSWGHPWSSSSSHLRPVGQPATCASSWSRPPAAGSHPESRTGPLAAQAQPSLVPCQVSPGRGLLAESHGTRVAEDATGLSITLRFFISLHDHHCHSILTPSVPVPPTPDRPGDPRATNILPPLCARLTAARRSLLRAPIKLSPWPSDETEPPPSPAHLHRTVASDLPPARIHDHHCHPKGIHETVYNCISLPPARRRRRHCPPLGRFRSPIKKRVAVSSLRLLYPLPPRATVHKHPPWFLKSYPRATNCATTTMPSLDSEYLPAVAAVAAPLVLPQGMR